MPIIYQLEQNKNILKFIDNDFELQNTNIFTFLVGKNSVGKSRLLRSLIIHALEEDKFDKVLALSNTQYHKFPSYRDLPNKEQISNNKYTRLAFEARTPIYSGGYDYRKKINNFSKKNYHYLFNFFDENNIKFHKNLNTNLNFAQSFESFLTQFSFKEKPYYNLLTILDFLKLDHYVKCTILPTNSFKTEDLNIKINNYFNNSKNITSEEYEIFRRLKDSLYDLKNLRSFDLLHLSLYELESISFLIESGLVRIYKVSFSKDKKIFNYTDLSSGELAGRIQTWGATVSKAIW